MLDERTTCLLKIINEKCVEGSYKVISLNELFNAFPEKYVADADLIRQIVSSLNVGGYISLRYDRDDEFCLAPTPKGRQVFEAAEKVTEIKRSYFKIILPHLFNFCSIFLAVFAAITVAHFIGLLC